MAFSYKNKRGHMYWLHSKDVKLKSTGKIQKIFFFSKDKESHGGSITMPSGFEVIESERTGLPMLKKKLN